MPKKKAAYKELRRSKARHFKNISTSTELKTLKKNLERLIAEKKLTDAKKVLNETVSKLNRAVTKGIVKKNTASRTIGRLMKKLSAASAKK